VLLSVIGIYGVIAYNITQRTNEIGVRMALGAQHRDIIRLIMGQAGKLIGLGLLIGLAGSLAGSRLLQSLLFEVSPYDPASLVLIVLLLTTVALLACYLPARRATKVDPTVALRAE
jgi:putative ABC transport system permease protein